MVDYIDGHKDEFGVEPICSVLPIAPSTYYAVKSGWPGVTGSRNRTRTALRRPLVSTASPSYCLAPGVMEARIPRKDASYGSTTEVPR